MKQNQFAIVPIEVATDRRLTLEQTRVLIALFSFRSKNTDTVWPSRAAISERTGMHPSNISTATTALMALGWLEKVGDGGRSKATRYTIRVPDFEHETVADSATQLKSKTVAVSATVNDANTVADWATVAESATVAQSARGTVAESARGTVAHSARGKEHTNRTNHRTDHIRRGCPAAEKPVRPASEISADKTETELQAACRETWAAYGEAYERRYGARPVRNASVNARVKQFVQRIGYDESPAVARFYVDSVTDAFVLRKVHEVGLLLSGAEGYRTQWASGRTADAQPNRQEAQESRNRAVANEWLQQQGAHA